jgi:Zn-finger nucleic acid-binding protein
MNATTLNCFSCGAAVVKDAPNCQHCGARLATISCPSCFGMMFQGAKFCPHCGSAAAQWDGKDSKRPCPVCRVSMLHGTLRDVRLHECPKCFGLWLDSATFAQVCRSAEQQSAILGSAQPAPWSNPLGPIRYLRCPQCNDLMHRMNFARCSGVIVDVCRAHGTWFEVNELHRIVQFIRAGGLDQARAREKADLADERRRVQAARTTAEHAERPAGSFHAGGDLLSQVLGVSSDLFIKWIRR